MDGCGDVLDVLHNTCRDACWSKLGECLLPCTHTAFHGKVDEVFEGCRSKLGECRDTCVALMDKAQESAETVLGLCLQGKCFAPCYRPSEEPRQKAPHYGNPKFGCKANEQAVHVPGRRGSICSPSCESSQDCPTDLPSGRVVPKCDLKTAAGEKRCRLVCEPDAPGQCGSGHCESVGDTEMCTFDVPMDVVAQGQAATIVGDAMVVA